MKKKEFEKLCARFHTARFVTVSGLNEEILDVVSKISSLGYGKEECPSSPWYISDVPRHLDFQGNPLAKIKKLKKLLEELQEFLLELIEKEEEELGEELLKLLKEEEEEEEEEEDI